MVCASVGLGRFPDNFYSNEFPKYLAGSRVTSRETVAGVTVTMGSRVSSWETVAEATAQTTSYDGYEA